ncbi:VOC family protein [Taklimakanibacter deserti]|uniref:VOC family protein n=1 Tax=Taklimakanibacter deserti TaxID=2267839 RepID=UPI000E659F5D
MLLHRGRLLDHVHLNARDLEASKRFYKAVIEALGKDIAVVEGPGFFYADELWVQAVTAGSQATRVHIAFQAEDHDTVRRFHEAGVAAGGRDNGAPGPRNYHPGYFAAFLLDPDGNNVEAVYHGEGKRSAASVEILATLPGED